MHAFMYVLCYSSHCCSKPSGPHDLGPPAERPGTARQGATATAVGPGAVRRGARGGAARTALGHRHRRGAQGGGGGKDSMGGDITLWEGKQKKIEDETPTH